MLDQLESHYNMCTTVLIACRCRELWSALLSGWIQQQCRLALGPCRLSTGKGVLLLHSRSQLTPAEGSRAQVSPQEVAIGCASPGPLRLLTQRRDMPCRLGGALLMSKLPLKSIKLQPVKQGTGPAGVTFRAFVSSSTYLQAYRVSVGLLPKLHTLHDHLVSSGIPLAPAGQAERDATYSCDGLRAFALAEVGPSIVWTPLQTGRRPVHGAPANCSFC